MLHNQLALNCPPKRGNPKRPGGKLKAIFLLTGTIILGRLILHFFLYQNGFNAITADDFGRVVSAAVWSLDSTPLLGGYWLPIHTTVIGTALKGVWDLLWVPRVLTAFMGITSIIFMFQLAKHLTGELVSSFVAAGLLFINPAHIWLSSTPLTAMYYFTTSLGGLYFIFLYLNRKGKVHFAIAGATLLMISNGIRFEAWVFTFLITLVVLARSILFLRAKMISTPHFLTVSMSLIIIWIVPVVWMGHSLISTGNPLASLSAIQTYKSNWNADGSSLLPYLTTFWQLDPLATIILPLGIGLPWLSKHNGKMLRLYAFFIITLLVAVLGLYGGQAEPTGNLIRYLAPYQFFTYPLIAVIFIKLGRNLFSYRVGKALYAICLILLLSITQFSTAFEFSNDPSSKGLAVGQEIARLRQGNEINQAAPVVIELSYWEYLAIHVGANDISGILYDRPLDFETRSSRSLISSDLDRLKSCLLRYNPSFLIVKTDTLKRVLRTEFKAYPAASFNDYAFYVVEDFIYRQDENPLQCPGWFAPKEYSQR